MIIGFHRCTGCESEHDDNADQFGLDDDVTHRNQANPLTIRG